MSEVAGLETWERHGVCFGARYSKGMFYFDWYETEHRGKKIGQARLYIHTGLGFVEIELEDKFKYDRAKVLELVDAITTSVRK
jgi:hypothetical protein